MNELRHWFRLLNTLDYDLPFFVAAFERKFNRKPTILWTRDGQTAPEKHGLVSKVDKQILPGELCLE